MRPIIAASLAGVVVVWITLSVVWLVATTRRNSSVHYDEDDYAAPSITPSIMPTPSPVSPSRQPKQTPSPTHALSQCHVAQAQASGVADDNGRTCARDQLVAETNCCPPWSPLYDCESCQDKCCATYHSCVSCCMSRPNKAFHLCSSQCRTSSKSLDANGRYSDEERHFCWAVQTPGEVRPSKKPDSTPAPSGIKWLKLSPDK